MTSEDTEFGQWIGRQHIPPDDEITARLIAEFEATFAPVIATQACAPIGLHWCLFAPAVPEISLGEDGHPAKGGFLPPIPLPRRMWAGGEVEFIQPLHQGDSVNKTSQIEKIAKKSGKSGSLYFVTVAHAYSVAAAVCVRERQNIVYREAAIKMISSPKAPGDVVDFDEKTVFQISPITLFRYSALTFNAHRIHYDLPYTRCREYYPDLVVHGPLQATALLNFATSLEGQPPRSFRYRGTAPALGAQTLTLGANRLNEKTCHMAVVTVDGVRSMEAEASW